MNTRRLPIVLALAAILLSVLACATLSGELTMSNFRTAKDQEGTQPTTTFAPGDTIYAVMDLSNAPKGTVVSSKWYAVNAEGVDPNTELDTADITTDQELFTGNLYFYFPPATTWPAGSYKVEIYLNGTLKETLEYSVQ